MRTHFKVERYDHAPSHLSRKTTLSASVRSGKSKRLLGLSSYQCRVFVQKPFSYSFSSAAILILNRSSLVLAGLPGLLSFFKPLNSSSCWCTNLCRCQATVKLKHIYIRQLRCNNGLDCWKLQRFPLILPNRILKILRTND
jgi:hypothetical protein